MKNKLPIDLKNKFMKTIINYIKPVNYNLKCFGCRSELSELLVKIAYQHFKKEQKNAIIRNK